MDKDKKLQELLDNDPLGLLNVKPSTSPAMNEDERLVASFQEINEFFEQNKREPKAVNGIQEHQLYSRLKSIRTNPIKIEMLKGHDIYSLLSREPQDPISIDSIIENDPLGLLDDDSASLFELKNIKPTDKKRAETDFVARRKPCKDFSKYEPLFKSVQMDLSTGNRKLIPFTETLLKVGNYYIQNGILLFLESVDYEKRKWKRGEKEKNRIREFEDGRTRTIFENETESNMLLRSLSKALNNNGYAVTDNIENLNKNIVQKFNLITNEDKEAGYIYILSSQSINPQIKEIKNLFKIGFSRSNVEERIKYAIQDPTFLMADVKIIMTFKCYNINPQKFEKLIHNFFGNSCLNIDVFDKNGMRHTPREWFIAPLDIIEKAIHYIITGQIVYYRYDFIKEEIVRK